MTESWWPVARGGELVGYLTDEEHDRLLAAAEPCTAEAGDLVFQKGSPSRSSSRRGDLLIESLPTGRAARSTYTRADSR